MICDAPKACAIWMILHADAAGRHDGDAVAAPQVGRVTNGAVRREDARTRAPPTPRGEAVRKREDVGRRHHGVLGEAGHRVHRDRRAIETAQPGRAVVQRALQPVHREEAVAQIVAPGAARRQNPHGMMNADTTRVPTAGPVTPGPRAATVPEISWPMHRRGRKGDLRLHDVQIGVTDAAGAHLDEHFAGEWLGHWNLLDAEPAGGGIEDGGGHGLHGDRERNQESGSRNQSFTCVRRRARPSRLPSRRP